MESVDPTQGPAGRVSNDEHPNVIQLRRRASADDPHAHPSGPRPVRTSHPSVDDALGALRSARPAPSSLRSVLAARPEAKREVRVALAVLAAAQLAMGIAWLVGNVPFGGIVGSPTAAHLSRDAALGVVLGTIGVIVAWRPRWSLSLVPVAGAIVAVQAIGLVADAAKGQRGFHFEFPHALAIIVGVLIFYVSRKRRLPATAA